MPIIDEEDSLINVSPTEQSNEELNPIQITSDNVNLPTVDNRWVPRFNLLTHIEGSIWVVDYFKQVLTKNTELSGQQITLSAPYQQYKLIKQLELKVTSALTSTQDDSKTTIVTGEAILNGIFIPNDNDMFLADMGEGSIAVFTINKTQKLSIYNESAYQLSYTLMTTDSQYIEDLNRKVIEDTYYYPKRLVTGDNPIISNVEYNNNVEIEKQFTKLISYYFNRFFSNEFKTLLVPGQVSSTYDHYLVNAILSQFNTDHCDKIREIRKLNVQEDEILRCDSIWDAIIHRNKSYLNTSFKKAGLVHCTAFSPIPLTNGIRFTGINKAIYPIDPTLTVDTMLKNNAKTVIVSKLAVEELNDIVLYNALKEEQTSIESIPSFYVLNKDDYYILSNEFYTNTLLKSRFELMVMDFIEEKPIDNRVIIDLVNKYHLLSLVEQFYYIPIILIIMKSILRGI